MQKRILVIGTASVDLTMSYDYLPGHGQTVTGNSFKFLPGGKGANAVVAASRLGGDAMLCTRVGRDMNGERVRRIFADNGVDTRFVKTDPRLPTGLSVLMSDEGGSKRAVIYPAANSLLTEEDVENAFTAYPDAVITQLEMPESIILKATAFAAEQGIPVVIDAVPARRDFPFDKLQNVEIFSPNAAEAYAYTGILPSNSEKSLQVCRLLSQMVKAEYYVLKLGDRGSFIYDGKYYHVVPSYDMKELDHTGAGDAFTAALTVEYLNTGDIKHACEFANAAAALTVSKEGAIPALPTREEIAAFADRHGLAL